jgi:hypothetical protein
MAWGKIRFVSFRLKTGTRNHNLLSFYCYYLTTDTRLRFYNRDRNRKRRSFDTIKRDRPGQLLDEDVDKTQPERRGDLVVKSIRYPDTIICNSDLKPVFRFSCIDPYCAFPITGKCMF